MFEIKGGKAALKDGVELYKAAANSTTDFGTQLKAQKVTNTDVEAAFESQSTKVAKDDQGTQLVEAKDLKDLFNTDGSIKTTFYAKASNGTWTEVGAEQVSKFINVTPGQVAAAEKQKLLKKLIPRLLPYLFMLVQMEMMTTRSLWTSNP